ncbi:MAG: TonB-dependent receptor [Sulfurovum sp.]|nr:TonB-dependent receptor [Sulfurovum sp.]
MVCFSTFIWAETITLDPINILETNLSSGTFVLSQNEAMETASFTLQERLEQDTSFNVVVGDKGEGAISFRGLDFKNTEYVEDGIPLYRNVNGFTDTKFTMTNAALQINDGSGTSLLGVSPMGGEVQINSTTPTKAFESTASTIISTNDEYYHAYTGSMTDNVYIQANASYYRRSDYTLSREYDTTSLQETRRRLNSDKDQKNISVKSGIFIDDKIHLAAKVSVTRAEYGVPPNVYTDLDFPVWNAYARIDRKDLNSFYLYSDYDRDDLLLSVRAYYDDYEDIYKIYNEPEYQTSWPAVTYDDARLGTVIKGIKTQYNHTSTFIFQAEENEHIRRGGDLNTTKSQVDTFKLSFLHLWKLNTLWQLEGGMSAALMQTKKSAEASATEPPDDKNTLDAQVKVIYTGDQNILYGSIAKKSRMPTMSEMFTFFPWDNANPDLKPEKSMQYTLGYQHDLSEKMLLDLSLYYYDIDDLIVYRDSGYINLENAEHYGAELRVNSTYFDKNHVRFSYAYTHTRDSEGEALEFIPLHQFRIEDTFSISEKWKAYLGYQYIGSRYSPNSATYSDEQIKLDTYHLVDTQIAYQVSNSTQCRAGIKNMLDESYEWRYGYPSEGRSYYLSLEWKL